jgi:uncharacterized protein YcbX
VEFAGMGLKAAMSSPTSGHVAGIFRHPVKGFTPEPLRAVSLAPGEGFPFDRVWAVENGPSGFDPAAPAWITKQKFTVLAAIPKVAAARTRLDEASGTLHAAAPGAGEIAVRLAEPQGRAAFEAWLGALLGEEATGPLRVIAAPAQHRFTDHPKGQVSIVNLASVRDLGQRMGAELDPLRFRANVYVEGWPAWAESAWQGKALMLGWARAEVFKPIVRCVATHVNPATAVCDQEVTKALFDHYGHVNCGIYVRVTSAGAVGLGDAVTIPQAEPAAKPDAEWA